MKKFSILTLWAYIVLCVGAISCDTSDEQLATPQNITRYSSQEEQVYKNVDPFSIEVMQEAYNSLYPELTRGINSDNIQIKPTHRYIEFLPTTIEQIDALNQEFTIFNFPLDSVPKTEENEVINITSNDNKFYAMIEYDAIIPDSIAYNELSLLHNPQSTDISTELVDEIIAEAYSISMQDNVTRENVIKPWRPNGTITVWDDLTECYVPISGLVVYVTNSKTSAVQTAVTDYNGYFEAPLTFVDDVSYLIPWRDDNWAIKFDATEPAISVSSSIRMPLELNISKSSVSSYYAATIYRAASYYWNDESIFYTPPTTDEQLRIYCYDEVSCAEYYNSYGLFWPCDRSEDEPNIEIWCKNHRTDSIIGTAFHELGHAVHYYTINHNSFHNTASIIIESWAEYIQSYLLDDFYMDLELETGIDCMSQIHDELYHWCDDMYCYTTYTPDYINRQNWRYNVNNSNIEYSPMFIDIRDPFNQRDWHIENNMSYTNIPNDNVCINNIGFIEQLVFTCNTVQDVKDAVTQYVIENNLNISTEDIDNLFSLYLLVTDEIADN